MKSTPRYLFLIGGLIGLIMLGSAYWLEYGLKLNPCPLCLLQRYALWIMTFLFFIAGFCHQKIISYFYSFLIMAFGLIGSTLAIRQIWIQHLPKAEVPSCTAGLKRLLEIHPLLEVLKISFYSAGECASETFSLYGFSLASLSFIGFIVLMGIVILAIIWIKRI